MFKALESLNTEENNLPDRDGDMPDGALFEAHYDVCAEDKGMSDCAGLSNTIDDLEHLHSVVCQHGVSQSLLAFANKDGVLSGAIPAFAAVEALGTDAAPDSAEAEAVKSSVTSKIGDLMAIWFKKSWDAISGLGKKIGALIAAGFNHIVGAAKWAAGKVFDGAKAVATTVTAHPVASIMALLATIAGAAVVVHKMWSSKLPADETEYTEWLKQVERAMGEGPVDGGDNHAAASGEKTEKASALGYVKENWDKLISAAKAAFSPDGSLGKIGASIASNAKTAFEAVKGYTGEAAKYARKALAYLMEKCEHLWKKAPATFMRYLSSAFKIFRGLFSKGTSSAAA